MAHRPLIGVVPLWDDTLNSLWMLPGYFDGIIEAGGIPVMLPLTDDETTIEQLVSQCDGFLVTGGHDVDPERYGEAAGPKTVKLCKARDRMEERLIPSVIAADKPLLGICRGIQSLNVALGGTLWQDLPDEHPSPVVHHGDKPPYDPVVHEVSIAPDSPLARALWPLGDNGPSEAEAVSSARLYAGRQQLSPSGDSHAGPGTGTDGHCAGQHRGGGLDAGQAFRLGRPMAS